MMSTIIASSLLIFYTDYIGLDNVTVFGYAILIYGIWNAINDPLFGYFSDKKVSEGALRIPLMRRGMPFMLIGFLMTILVIPGWPDWKIFLVLFFGLIIFDLGKALSMVNYQAYLITVANTPQKTV
jgi:GPH family glycoside/pentoside/hexuronide:cation symporter